MRTVVSVLVSIIVILGLVTGCTPAAPTAVPTKLGAAVAATAAPSVPSAAPAAAATNPPAPATSGPAAPAPTIAAASAATKIKRGGTLRAAHFEEWAPTLDPHSRTGTAVGYELLYDCLLRATFDLKTGARTLKPQLAESWEQQGPKTIVMKLRKDAVFQDGSKFNAEVAKWNLDRMRTWEKSAAKTDVMVLDSVDVVDEYTIRLNLKAAPAGILPTLASGLGSRAWMASKAAVDKDGQEAFARRTVGTGSMQFVEWVTGDHITVKKWDKYWDKGEDGQPLPYLDGAMLRVIVNETVGVTEMRTGTLDVYSQILPRNYSAIKSAPDVDMIPYPWYGQVNYLIFNFQKAPFNDLKMRQAAIYALDRESMAKAIGQGVGLPAYYYWGPGDLGYDESVPRYNFDLNKSKQLVKDAGYPNGVDVPCDTFSLDMLQRTGEAIKQFWDQAGIRTTLGVEERTAFVSKLQVSNFQVANSYRGSVDIDPDSYSYRLTTDGTFNFSHFSSADMDKCMEEGRNTVEDAKRIAIYKRCQQIMYENLPYESIWTNPLVLLVSKKVKGWEPFMYTSLAGLRNVWLDK
jgi:peptide/nickel transport system substrate-binding protein